MFTLLGHPKSLTAPKLVVAGNLRSCSLSVFCMECSRIVSPGPSERNCVDPNLAIWCSMVMGTETVSSAPGES